MSAYDVNNINVSSLYDVSSYRVSIAYDISGNIIFGSRSEHDIEFLDNLISSVSVDTTSTPPAEGTEYMVFRIAKTKKDGTKQYPFIRYPSRGTALNLNRNEGWNLIINAGLGVNDSIPVDGVLIENGVVINNDPGEWHIGTIPLTIDLNGDLSCALSSTTGQELVELGIKFACAGFCPIIVDSLKVSFPDVHILDFDTGEDRGNHFRQLHPRLIIGQYPNGDYCIVTCQGVLLENGSTTTRGWQLMYALNVCYSLGLKFAYCLDGGRSVCTIVNGDLLTPNTQRYYPKYPDGRTIPSFIVFNGSTTFSIPPARTTS